MRWRNLVVGGLAAVAAALALAFLLLPVAAIFLRVPPGKLLHQLSSGVVTDALIVSAKTSVSGPNAGDWTTEGHAGGA